METHLWEIVAPETAGDPMCERKWVRSSLCKLRHCLARAGHAVSAPTVSRLLKKHDYARRVKAKAKEAGSQHPDRAIQFHYLEVQKQAFAATAAPIISVATKKKELIGNFKKAGQVWCQRPEEVNVHDVLTDALGRAVPDGIDDLQRQQGAVSVGASAATPEFAVTAIERWWEDLGGLASPQARHLVIVAAAGGSNGYRPRMWQAHLQSPRSDRLGLHVTVGHYPTGCSTWNPIEHRLFSQLSCNWAGKPLRTFETRLGSRRDTTTTTGRQVTARLIADVYQTGRQVTDAVMKTRHWAHPAVCPPWNDTIRPRAKGALMT